MTTSENQSAIIDATRHWLENLVVGLNLCPFARTPWRQGRIRFTVSEATTQQQLAQDLGDELLALKSADPDEVETTLLIHPDVLDDFFDYNDFLEIADRLVEEMDLEGTIQVASFHPDYQFAGCPPDDPANCTNRSPFPMLHLLREKSVEAATASLSDPDAVYERNIETMRKLGLGGWKALMP